jgi:hypothetical protein
MQDHTLIRDRVTAHCRRCGNTFQRAHGPGRRQRYCRAQCRQAASLDMLRERRFIERLEQRRIAGTIAWCRTCDMSFTPAATAASHDGHSWKVIFQPCFACGSKIPSKDHYKPGDYIPDNTFCSESCWLRWWRGQLASHPDTTMLAEDMSAEDVAYHPAYVRSQGRSGVLPDAEIEELFGTLNSPLDGYHLAEFGDFGDGEEVIQTARTIPLEDSTYEADRNFT